MVVGKMLVFYGVRDQSIVDLHFGAYSLETTITYGTLRCCLSVVTVAKRVRVPCCHWGDCRTLLPGCVGTLSHHLISSHPSRNERAAMCHHELVFMWSKRMRVTTVPLAVRVRAFAVARVDLSLVPHGFF